MRLEEEEDKCVSIWGSYGFSGVGKSAAWVAVMIGGLLV